MRLNSVVTGGINGIGSEIVSVLKKRGDKLFVFDIFDKQDKKVLKIEEQGIVYFKVDVANVDSIQKAFNAIFDLLKNYENKNLDLLVNNAGITRDSLAIRLKKSDWDSVLEVNLKGTFFCCQAAIKKMIRQEKSYIVNISSVVGISGNPGQVNYAASKAGVIALTKSLAAEYGSRNILINAIAPGFIQTDMTNKLPDKIKKTILNRISLKRFGQPRDVAKLIDFLSSGDADYITGQVLVLDGGLF